MTISLSSRIECPECAHQTCTTTNQCHRICCADSNAVNIKPQGFVWDVLSMHQNASSNLLKRSMNSYDAVLRLLWYHQLHRFTLHTINQLGSLSAFASQLEYDKGAFVTVKSSSETSFQSHSSNWSHPWLSLAEWGSHRALLSYMANQVTNTVSI